MNTQVFIVMRGENSSYSYSGVEWNVHQVFATMDSAKAYIEKQDKQFEYGITVEEVLA
jgi:hypothetical protein